MTVSTCHRPLDHLVETGGWHVVRRISEPDHHAMVLKKENVELEYDASRDGIFWNVEVDIYKFPIELVSEFLNLTIPDGSSPFDVVNENFELVRGALSVPETRGKFREWRIAKEKRPDDSQYPKPPAIDLLSHLKQNLFTLLPWRQI